MINRVTVAMTLEPRYAFTSLDTSYAYGSGSRRDAVQAAAVKAPQFSFFARKLWTTEDGNPRPIELTIADGAQYGCSFQAKDGFTQGNAASSAGYCLAQSLAIDEAFHHLDAIGLADLAHIWAYHDDIILMTPADK